MYAIKKDGDKAMLLICGDPGDAEIERVLRALKLEREDVKFVTEAEMHVFGNVVIENMSLELKNLAMPYKPILINKAKPHLDKNVRRHHRKSKW